MVLDRLPDKTLLLMVAAVKDLDSIREATASACIRSIFPFIKDLMVNSPGFGLLAPFLHAVFIIS